MASWRDEFLDLHRLHLPLSAAAATSGLHCFPFLIKKKKYIYDQKGASSDFTVSFWMEKGIENYMIALLQGTFWRVFYPATFCTACFFIYFLIKKTAETHPVSTAGFTFNINLFSDIYLCGCLYHFLSRHRVCESHGVLGTLGVCVCVWAMCWVWSISFN